MGTFGRRIAALHVTFALIALVESCATFGPGRVEVPCDESVEALFSPVKAGEGIEIVGKLRLDLSRYRINGRERSTDLAQTERVARPEPGEEDRQIGTGRQGPRGWKRTECEYTGRPTRLKGERLMKTVCVQVVQDASPRPGSAKRSGRTMRVTRKEYAVP